MSDLGKRVATRDQAVERHLANLRPHCRSGGALRDWALEQAAFVAGGHFGADLLVLAAARMEERADK